MSVGDTSITFRDVETVDDDSYSAVATPLINKYLKKYLKGNVTIILWAKSSAELNIKNQMWAQKI